MSFSWILSEVGPTLDIGEEGPTLDIGRVDSILIWVLILLE